MLHWQVQAEADTERRSRVREFPNNHWTVKVPVRKYGQKQKPIHSA